MLYQFSYNESSLPLSDGKELSLNELLNARDSRAAKQKIFLSKGNPIVSLTLNVMGSVKTSPLLDVVFEKAVLQIERTLKKKISIIDSFIEKNIAGSFAIWSVDNSDIYDIKHSMMHIEESSLISRLWDIDVIGLDAKPLTRTDFNKEHRSCLICDRPAKICARERTHKINNLIDNIKKRLYLDNLAESIGEEIRLSLQEEVSLTPKAGLVDKDTNYGHKDMNWQMFIDSSNAISKHLTSCIKKGMTFSNKPSTPDILKAIRPIGIDAEKAMYRVTNGVNTHKGAIFSFAILAAAMGKCLSESNNNCIYLDDVLKTVSLIGKDLPDELYKLKENSQKTSGQLAFIKHNILGIRGEVSCGFPIINDISLPTFLKEYNKDRNYKRALLISLISLYSKNNDTNTISRVGISGLKKHKEWAKKLLTENKILEDENKLVARIKSYNKECNNINLSAGGSADLLALTIFINKIFINPEMETLMI